jgi:hypothetical protein
VVTDYEELFTIVEDPDRDGLVWIFKGETLISEGE